MIAAFPFLLGLTGAALIVLFLATPNLLEHVRRRRLRRSLRVVKEEWFTTRGDD